MLLKSLSIRKLFNAFSYDLKFTTTDRPFLLTGPNGYGKTTILTIIDCIAKKKLIYFYQLPFEKIVFRFDDGQVLKIQSKIFKIKNDKGNDIVAEGEKEVIFEWKSGENVSIFRLNKKIIRDAFRLIRFYDSNYREYPTLLSKEFYDLVENNEKFYDAIARELGQTTFLMLLSNISTTYVKAQRINVDLEKSSIEDIVGNLKTRLENDHNKYLQVAEQHDNKFMDRLMSSSKKYTKERYEREAKKISIRIEELKNFGLVNALKIPNYVESKSEILTAYIQDVSEKLENYKTTIIKIKLFSELLKNKNFVNKKITYSPLYGLRVISTIDGSFININKLSSGEQNEIIMLYNFIYNVSNDSILLVDEPENSLHVVWQKDLFNELEKISKTIKTQIIIATHSPQIIGNRWNDCYDLYEKNL